MSHSFKGAFVQANRSGGTVRTRRAVRRHEKLAALCCNPPLRLLAGFAGIKKYVRKAHTCLKSYRLTVLRLSPESDSETILFFYFLSAFSFSNTSADTFLPISPRRCPSWFFRMKSCCSALSSERTRMRSATAMR